MSRIHVFPNWRGNPYLNMLYIGARSEGWSVDGTTRLDDLIKALSFLNDDDVFHIHWTSPILQHANDRSDAKNALARFKQATEAATARGVRLVWTVHNTIPHDVKYLDLEVRLAEFLSRVSSRIIQLSRGTRRAVAEFYELPIEKLVTLRHASYVGVYSEPPTEILARRQLGVPRSSPTIGFVGQMRGYKGVTSLLHATRLVMDRVPDLTLLLAGKTDDAEVARISAEVPPGLRTVRQHSFVPDSELGRWFSAADLMVFPYERILNSGSMYLAATFSRLCILPAEPHLLDEFGAEPWIRFYEAGPEGPSNLAAVIEQSLDDALSARDAARRFAEGYTTMHMAWDYVHILEGLSGISGGAEGVYE